MHRANSKVAKMDTSYIVSPWITPTEIQMWLYFIKESQKISIVYNNFESEIEIKESGKIKLNGDCKLSTPELNITNTIISNVQYIKVYLPEYNLTFPKRIKIDLPKRTLLKQLIEDPKKLTKLSLDIKDIEKYLEKSNNHVFNNKYNVSRRSRYCYFYYN